MSAPGPALTRNGVERPIGLDHAVVDGQAQLLLVGHIPLASKPVHRLTQSLQATSH